MSVQVFIPKENNGDSKNISYYSCYIKLLEDTTVVITDHGPGWNMLSQLLACPTSIGTSVAAGLFGLCLEIWAVDCWFHVPCTTWDPAKVGLRMAASVFQKSAARIIRDRKNCWSFVRPFDLEAFFADDMYCRLLLWAFNGSQNHSELQGTIPHLICKVQVHN